MASKRRIRRKGCEGKRRYATYGDAQAESSRARSEREGQGIEPYQCEFCGGWHIGHRPGTGRAYVDAYGEFLQRERWKR